MISTQALTLLLVLIVPCASQYAPGFGCNDTFLMVELHKCEKTMLQALIDNPSANCREEVKKLQKCSRKLIVDRCYSSLYALYPKLREAVEKMMDVTLKQVNKASFYCSDHKMKINWEMIPNAVKKVLPCDKRFFEESLQCAEKFRTAFNKNKKDPDLCRLYTETKRCSHRISYIYCTSSTILSVNTLNPFCERGRDLEEMPNDMTVKKKPLKCMVHVCSNSSSPFFPTLPCAPPQEITCVTPEGLPFQYDACMTTSIKIEPVAGVIMTQVNRNCSSTFLCKHNVLCNTANSTGALKGCSVNCCEGELCNKDSSYQQTKIKPTKPAAKRKGLRCMSYYCTNSSSPLPSFNPTCTPLHEITCDSLGRLPHGIEYDTCMTSSVIMEPVAGVKVTLVNRNCSSSSVCNSNGLCNLMNNTGIVKRCDINCCKGDLCNNKSIIQTEPQAIKPRASSIKCISSMCTKSSKAVSLSFQCDEKQEITCESVPGLSFSYDRCMTSRLSMEVAGITVEQEIRNCSSSFACQPELLCNTVNTTGLLKKCDIQCCEGNLCNREGRSTKSTPRPQTATPKVFSPRTEMATPTKSQIAKRKGLRCMSYYCTNSSSPLPSFNPTCTPLHEITCDSLGRLPHGIEYDTCMTSSVLMEPVAGVKVTLVNRNCSSSSVCNSNGLCNLMNNTGIVKRCDINCCKGDLCNNKSIIQTEPQAIKPRASSIKCISSMCTKSSKAVSLSFQCDEKQEITCESVPGLSFSYDRCMTSRLSMEVAGITVEQEIRNCSSSFACQPELLCNTVNTTGLLKKCDIQCCEGNLCNREGRSTKSTPRPQTATPKVFSPRTEMATPTKSQIGKPLKCMVFACSNSSSSCTTPRVRTCPGPQGLPFGHDACMTTRVIFEPTAGVIVEQESRDCSSSLQCQQPKQFCDVANATGLVKRCDVYCCTEDLCNKKKKTKPTLKPQSVTQKVSSPPTELPKEYRSKFKKGFWTKVTPSMISSHLFHGLRVKYRSVNNGLVIEAHVISYGCRRRPGSGLTTFIRGNWTRILYTQEFMGSASCWRVFGNSGRKGGYEIVERSGLEEFDARKGDIIFNELKMGGKDHDTFNGITHMCGRPAKSFWHAQNGQALRRATVMLRRKTDGSRAGIHTATSCGQPSFNIKDIFVYH